MKDTAKQYTAYALRCFPVRKDKTPACDAWKQGVAPSRFSKNAYGIGVICGMASRGVEVLDFDNHQGDAKERITEYMARLKERKMWTKNLVVVSTAGGGYHVIYRCESVGGNRKLAMKAIDDGHGGLKPDTVIETRGEGGYVVAAPTPGYKVRRGCMSDIPLITSEVREVMLSTAAEFNEWADVRRDAAEVTGRPGDLFNEDNQSVFRVIQALEGAGWVSVAGGRWRRPGKSQGWSATLGKVAPKTFYVFSSNAHPFEMNRAYLPFQVVALLEYDGDFARFAGELSREYEMGAKKEEPPKAKPEKIDLILQGSRVDLSKPVMAPPVAISLKEVGLYDVKTIRMFTLGNFSAITGKAKSKKTIFLTMLSAVVIGGAFDDKFRVGLPPDKRKAVYFDTEQGDYDVYNTARRIQALAGKFENFEMYQLRPFDPLKRCEIIDHYLKSNADTGFVVIDGIADLGTAINDEEEATRITTLLMQWTKNHGIHIATVLHQNKMNDFAGGHLGSYVMKKAEIIVSVTKDPSDRDRSVVQNDFSRGGDFQSFSFRVDSRGIPALEDNFIPEAVKYEEAPF